MDEILFLAHRIPYPPDRGDKIRSWNILRHLAGLGRVHLACLADDAADASHVAGLRAALGDRLGEVHVSVRSRGKARGGAAALLTGRPVSVALFDCAALRNFVDQLLGQGRIGTIFAFSGQMAQFVPEGMPFIMDFADMDSAKFAAYADEGRGLMAWVHRREARTLLAHEVRTAARADVSLFVSEAEADLFRPFAPGADIRAIQNGVDLDFYAPAGDFPRLRDVPGPLIAFTGQMDYAPNADAVIRFAEDVFPLIRQRFEEAHFAIVGRNPGESVRRLGARSNVLVTGAVEDIRSWLAASSVVVAPLRVARGVQNKVLEAMAMARPVMASTAAFEGIEAAPGRDLLVADSARAQADAVAGLLADPVQVERMGQAARAQMERAYRWEARLAPLARLVEGASGKAAA